MTGFRKLALGLVLLPLAGCAGSGDSSFLAPLGAIEPAAGPVDPADAATTETAALQVMSSVVAGDLLIGGHAAGRMLATPGVMPATGPGAEEAEGPVGIGDADAMAEASRVAAYERVTATQEADRRRQADQALLLERWMSTRITALPLTRSDIGRAQRLLADLGYDPGPIDGLAGPRTRAAVERFQVDHGIAASGEITPALIDYLAITQS